MLKSNLVLVFLKNKETNNYKDLFEYPIKKGQFVSIPGWWRDTENKRYKINGGFFKYYPKDCKYIYDKFMQDPNLWQNFYIKKLIKHWFLII